eukprot:scpid56643/ scgid33109/ 
MEGRERCHYRGNMVFVDNSAVGADERIPPRTLISAFATLGRVVSTFNGSEQRRRKWGQREVAVGPATYGAQQGVTASGDLLLGRTPEGDSAGTVDVVRLCMPARLAGELPK